MISHDADDRNRIYRLVISTVMHDALAGDALDRIADWPAWWIYFKTLNYTRLRDYT